MEYLIDYVLDKLKDFTQSEGYLRSLMFMPETQQIYTYNDVDYGSVSPVIFSDTYHFESDKVVEFVENKYGIKRVLVSIETLNRIHNNFYHTKYTKNNQILVEADTDIFNYYRFDSKDLGCDFRVVVIEEGNELIEFDASNLFVSYLWMKEDIGKWIASSGLYDKHLVLYLNNIKELNYELRVLYRLCFKYKDISIWLLNADVDDYKDVLYSIRLNSESLSEYLKYQSIWGELSIHLMGREVKWLDVSHFFEKSFITSGEEFIKGLQEANIRLYLPNLLKSASFKQRRMSKKCKGYVIF